MAASLDDPFNLAFLELEEPTVDGAQPGEDDRPESESEKLATPTTSPDGPTCEECGDLIPWAGRGRKPKRCALHKSRTAGAKRATTVRSTSKVLREELEGDLTKEIAFFGTGVSKVMPTTGVTLFKQSERTAKALVKIAGDNPRLLAVLELSARAVSFVDLGEVGLSLAIAVMIDAGRMSPDAAMAAMLGVSATWHELNDDEEVIDRGAANAQAVDAATASRINGTSGFEIPVPPRFERIT